VIGCLVEGAVLEALAQNVDNLVVDHAIPAELLIGLETADGIVRVALVDRRNAAEALVVPILLLLVRLHNALCGINTRRINKIY